MGDILGSFRPFGAPSAVRSVQGSAAVTRVRTRARALLRTVTDVAHWHIDAGGSSAYQ